MPRKRANSYEKITLPNGLRVITIAQPRAKTATALILVGAGSRYETRRTNGLSHFLEHMAFKGTTNRPSALHISSEIDGIGGEFNAFTSKDHTGFYIKAAAAKLPLLIDVLADMLLYSLFKAEEIEREKGVITEEINMYDDTPMRKIGDIFEGLLYGNHPLGWDIAGTRQSVAGITRRDFVNYARAVYQPNNTVVVIAGGVNQYDVVELVNDHLGIWQKGSVRSFKQLTRDRNAGNKPQVKLTYKKTEQAHLALGVRSYPLEHRKRYAETLLAIILGGGMSSRLFIEIRERRGLAYYVRADTSRYIDVGNFVVQAGVDKNRIDTAVTVILTEIERMKDAGDLAGDLARAKEYFKGKLLLGLEDSKDRAVVYGTQELLRNQIKTPEQVMERIAAVTADDVAEVAAEIFRPSRLNMAVIGPFREEGRFGRLLRV